MILNQFRWIDCIFNPEDFTEKLIEAISLCPPALRKETISYLPEIVCDSTHETVVDHLKALLESDSSFTAVVLDAFSSLHLSKEVLDQLRPTLLQNLASARIHHLPVILKFLFHSTSDKDGFIQVASEIRKSLDISTLKRQGNKGKGEKGEKSSRANETAGVETLIFESIRSALRFQKELAAAFVNLIKKSDKPSGQFALDFLVLLILYSIPSHQKTVVPLIRKKVSQKLFTAELLKKSLSGNGTLLQVCFSELLSIGGNLLSSTDSAVRAFGSEIFHLCFLEFPTEHERNETISQLMSSVGSSEREADAALGIFLLFATSYTEMATPYLPTFKGMLDYLEILTENQVRMVYRVFCLLSFSGEKQTDRTNEDIVIVLQKQLNCPDPIYKRIGLIGTSVLISVIGVPKLFTQRNTDTIDELFALASKVASTSKGHRAFFYDEIVRAVPQVHPQISKNIQDAVLRDVEPFLMEIPKEDTPEHLKYNPATLWENLDDFIEDDDFENDPLFLAIHEINDSNRGQEGLASLPTALRVMQRCLKRAHDELVQMEMLLTMPFLMFPKEDLTNFSTFDKDRQSRICFSLYYAVNWVREILNAFASVEDSKMRGQVISRLDNLIFLEKTLRQCLIELDSPAVVLCQLTRKSSKAQGDAKKKEKTEKAPQIAYGTINPGLVSVLRSFEMSVFRILTYSPMLTTTFPSDTLELNHEVLAFLLSALYSKIEHHFSPKVGFPGKTKPTSSLSIDATLCAPGLTDNNFEEFQEDLLELFPFLCGHLSRLVSKLVREKVDQGETQSADACFVLLLKCFKLVLGSKKLTEAAFRRFLTQSLRAFKPKGDYGEQVPLEVLRHETFVQFEKMSQAVTSFTSAGTFVDFLTPVCPLRQENAYSNDIESIHTPSRASLYRLSTKFLKEDWEVVSSKEHLSSLLRASIWYEKNPLDSISYYVAHVIMSPSRQKEDTVKYGTYSDSTLPIYFSVLLVELVKYFSLLTEGRDTPKAMLAEVHLCVVDFLGLIDCLKVSQKQVNIKSLFRPALMQGKNFVSHFISLIPFLFAHFREFESEIRITLKNLQGATRTLQRLCAQLKEEKDTALVSAVPALLKVLDSLLYKVKLLCEQKKVVCEIGSLRAKSLSGRFPNGEEEEEEENSEEEEEEEEEEAPKKGRGSKGRGKGDGKGTGRGRGRGQGATKGKGKGKGKGKVKGKEKEKEKEAEKFYDEDAESGEDEEMEEVEEEDEVEEVEEMEEVEEVEEEVEEVEEVEVEYEESEDEVEEVEEEEEEDISE